MVNDTQQIPVGYKQTDVGIIPEDWGLKKLGSVCDRITTGKLDANAMKMDGSYRFYTCARDYYFIDNYAFDDEALLISGNGANVGYIHYYKGKFNAYQRTYVLTGFSEDIFFTKLLLDKNLKERIRIEVNAGNTPYITMGTLSEMNIPYPTLRAEQEKIAEALSDIDSLISKLDQLIQKKKSIKQGAMQELLTGKRRLPGFRGEWEETTLGNVADIRKGQLITSNTIKDGNVPVIAGGKTPAYFHNKANRLGKTITVSASGASAGYVWMHSSPIFASDCSTIEESSNYSIGYIYYWLKLMQEEIYYLQTGGAQPHIHPSDLKPMPILIPSIEEQIAVEQILSDIDYEIDIFKTQKSKYQVLKQGMMQQLLTGKIRLI